MDTDEGTERSRWIVLAIEAVAFNLVAAILYDLLKRLDIAPTWVTENTQYWFFGTALTGLVLAYWWTRPSGKPRKPEAVEPEKLIDGLTVRERLSWFEIGLIKARNQVTRLQNHISALTNERNDLRANADQFGQERVELLEHNLGSLSTSFEAATKERDRFSEHLQQSIRDRQTMDYQLKARDAEIEHLKNPPAPAPYDGQLIAFVNAWLTPAWELTIPWILELRGKVQEMNGYYAGLIQEAVIEPAARVKGDVFKLIRRDNDAPRESLDALVAKMYRAYEHMIANMWHGWSSVGRPAGGAYEQRLREWGNHDEKTIDRLRELVSAPEFEGSQLHKAFTDIRDGGSAKLYRDRILER